MSFKLRSAFRLSDTSGDLTKIYGRTLKLRIIDVFVSGSDHLKRLYLFVESMVARDSLRIKNENPIFYSGTNSLFFLNSFMSFHRNVLSLARKLRLASLT